MCSRGKGIKLFSIPSVFSCPKELNPPPITKILLNGCKFLEKELPAFQLFPPMDTKLLFADAIIGFWRKFIVLMTYLPIVLSEAELFCFLYFKALKNGKIPIIWLLVWKIYFYQKWSGKLQSNSLEKCHCFHTFPHTLHTTILEMIMLIPLLAFWTLVPDCLVRIRWK